MRVFSVFIEKYFGMRSYLVSDRKVTKGSPVYTVEKWTVYGVWRKSYYYLCIKKKKDAGLLIEMCLIALCKCVMYMLNNVIC